MKKKNVSAVDTPINYLYKRPSVIFILYLIIILDDYFDGRAFNVLYFYRYISPRCYEFIIFYKIIIYCISNLPIIMPAVRGRRLRVFRGPQIGDSVQRTQLRRIRFAGRSHVRGQVRQVHVPIDIPAQ